MPAQTIFQWKENRILGGALAGTAGHEYSMWQVEGTPSHGGVPPSTPTNPTAATAGGIMQTNPAGGMQKWLTALLLGAPGQGGVYTLFDRMYHQSGFSGVAAGAQNLNGGSPATLSRHYTDPNGGADVGQLIFVEIGTSLGVTGQTISATYTNQAGLAGQVTQATTIGGTGFREAGRFIALPLAAGDTGAQSVTSVTLSGSTGTAGNFFVVVAKPLLTFVTNIGQGDIYIGPIEGNPTTSNATSAIEILTDACLFWSVGIIAAVATVAPIMAQTCFSFVDK